MFLVSHSKDRHEDIKLMAKDIKINIQRHKFEQKRQPIVFNRHQNFMKENCLDSKDSEIGPDDGNDTPEMLGPKLRKRFNYLSNFQVMEAI